MTAPTACKRCDGTGVMELRAGRGRVVQAVCIDCRCAGCGDPSPGVLCKACDDEDFVAVDTAHRRAADDRETVPRSDEPQPTLWGAA